MIYEILLLTSLLPIGVCIGSTFLGRATDRLVVVIACRMYARFSGLSVPAVSKIVLELHCTSRVTRKRLVVNLEPLTALKTLTESDPIGLRGSQQCLPRASPEPSPTSVVDLISSVLADVLRHYPMIFPSDTKVDGLPFYRSLGAIHYTPAPGYDLSWSNWQYYELFTDRLSPSVR